MRPSDRQRFLRFLACWAGFEALMVFTYPFLYERWYQTQEFSWTSMTPIFYIMGLWFLGFLPFFAALELERKISFPDELDSKEDPSPEADARDKENFS